MQKAAKTHKKSQQRHICRLNKHLTDAHYCNVISTGKTVAQNYLPRNIQS